MRRCQRHRHHKRLFDHVDQPQSLIFKLPDVVLRDIRHFPRLHQKHFERCIQRQLEHRQASLTHRRNSRRGAAGYDRNPLQAVCPTEFESNINGLCPPSPRPQVLRYSRNVRCDDFNQSLKVAYFAFTFNKLTARRRFHRQDTSKEWVRHGGRMIRRSPITVKGCLA